jgi:hypothetical protein
LEAPQASKVGQLTAAMDDKADTALVAFMEEYELYNTLQAELQKFMSEV